MFSKILRKLSGYNSISSSNSKFITNACRLRQMKKRNVSDWKRQMNLNREKQKITPKLLYLYNPWKYLQAKFNLLKFRILWDPQFAESEFIRGAKQAAVTMTTIIRKQNTVDMKQFTTPLGYKQITRDMLLSRDDTRLKLARFEPEHLRRAIPMNVVTKQNYGQRYCFIDMLFVALRNTKDFDSAEEAIEVKWILEKLDTEVRTPYELLLAPHRIVFAEIFVRFRRDYTEYEGETALQGVSDTGGRDWSVSFYKILNFDVLHYEPRKFL